MKPIKIALKLFSGLLILYGLVNILVSIPFDYVFRTIQAGGFSEYRGVKILQVTANSEADKAGLLEGDRITAVKGKGVRNISDFGSLLYNNLNQEVELTVRRDNQTENVRVYIDGETPGNFSDLLGIVYTGEEEIKRYPKLILAPLAVVRGYLGYGDSFNLNLLNYYLFKGPLVRLLFLVAGIMGFAVGYLLMKLKRSVLLFLGFLLVVQIVLLLPFFPPSSVKMIFLPSFYLHILGFTAGLLCMVLLIANRRILR